MLQGAFQHLKGITRKLKRGFFKDKTRGNEFKLKEGRCRFDIKKTFFTLRVMRHWNRLPGEAVDAAWF